MAEELAAANVNRSYSLAASSIAIFTFTLFFLFPKFTSGEADALLFQIAVVVMAVATFSFVFASLSYYCASLSGRLGEAELAGCSRRGDRFWLLGYTLLFLAPSVILFSIDLRLAGSVWLLLWLVYLVFVIRYFPRMQVSRS
jgi:hypothetical protein